MKTIAILAMVLLTGFGDCGHSRDEKPLIGEYNLQGHDFSGTLIFKGAISLSSLDKNKVSGNCTVVKVAETFEGAVDKKYSRCEGKVDGDDIMLDLAPSLLDGGLVFEGRWKDGRIAGTWRIESVAGGKTFGTFNAVKQ